MLDDWLTLFSRTVVAASSRSEQLARDLAQSGLEVGRRFTVQQRFRQGFERAKSLWYSCSLTRGTTDEGVSAFFCCVASVLLLRL